MERRERERVGRDERRGRERVGRGEGEEGGGRMGEGNK